MVKLNTVRFDDGFVVSTGKLVEFNTVHGSTGYGIVQEINKPSKGAPVVRVKPVSWTPKGYDFYPLRDGGYYCRPFDCGLFGGEIVRPA